MRPWEDALRETLLEYRGAEQEPFCAYNCCTFVIDYYRRRTGTDYSSLFNYRTPEDANDLIESGDGLVNLFASLLGKINAEPQPGSVCVVQVGAVAFAGGIAANGCVHVFLPDKGLGRVPLSKVKASWK